MFSTGIREAVYNSANDGHNKEAAIMPNWASNVTKVFRKAPKVAPVGNTVRANIDASKKARQASGFGGGLKSVTNTSETIRHMPNAQAGRVERGIAKSQGNKVIDPGSRYKKSKPAGAPAAPGTSAAPASGNAGWADKAKQHFGKHKGLYAAGAGGMALGSMMSGGRDSGQYQR